MKSLYKRFKWLIIVLGLVVFSLGLIVLIISINNKDMFDIVSYIIAGYCFAIALFNLLVTILLERKDGYNGISINLLFSGLLIGIGIALLDSQIINVVVNVLVNFLPALFFALAGVVVIKFVLLVADKNTGRAYSSWAIALILWTMFLTLGIVVLVNKLDNNADSLETFIFAIIGIVVMLIGLLVATYGIVLIVRSKEKLEKKPIKKSKKKANGAEIDSTKEIGEPKLVEPKDVVDIQTPVIKEDK